MHVLKTGFAFSLFEHAVLGCRLGEIADEVETAKEAAVKAPDY